MRVSLKNRKPLAQFKRRSFVGRARRGLIWGTSGVRLLGRLLLPRRRFYWLRLWFKYCYKLTFLQYRLKRKEKKKLKPKRRFPTFRFFWLRVRSCLPCTRKSKKSRMGKGKGKIVGWCGNMPAGLFIIEFKITRLVVARNIARYLRTRFPTKMQFITSQLVRNLQTFGGKTSVLPYFRRPELFTYRRYKRLRHRDVIARARTDIQYIK